MFQTLKGQIQIRGQVNEKAVLTEFQTLKGQIQIYRLLKKGSSPSGFKP